MYFFFNFTYVIISQVFFSGRWQKANSSQHNQKENLGFRTEKEFRGHNEAQEKLQGLGPEGLHSTLSAFFISIPLCLFHTSDGVSSWKLEEKLALGSPTTTSCPFYTFINSLKEDGPGLALLTPVCG